MNETLRPTPVQHAFHDKSGVSEKAFKRRTGSFAFYVAIPCAIAAFIYTTQCMVQLLSSTEFKAVHWGLFLQALLTGVVILAGSKFQRLSTFLHEVKHAVLVVCTGNILKEMKVGRDRGHVSYQMYKDTLHFEPFVMLAPYFLPLLSFPALIAALFLEEKHRFGAIYLLGLALGLDLMSAWREFHPHQTDLRRIFGGFFIARTFIFTANLFWISVCLLWLVGGANGFVFAGLEWLSYALDAVRSLKSGASE
jgi:hypothetical protein